MKTILKVLVLVGLSVCLLPGNVFAVRAVTDFVDSSGSSVSSYTIPYNANTSAVVYLQSDCGGEHNVVTSFCNAPNSIADFKVTVTGATYAEFRTRTANIVTNPNIYRTPALTLRLNTTDSAPATNDNILDVEGGPTTATIGLKGEHATSGTHADLTPDTVTIAFADYDGTMVVSTVSDFSSSATAFADGDTVYVQVTDYDENILGYSKQTLTDAVVVSSSLDSETFDVVETDNNTGIFDNTASGLSVATYDGSASDDDGTLEIDPTGETNITVTYTDPDTGHDDFGTDTASVTAITSASVVQDFLVEASTPQTAGTAFTLTVTARDSGGATLTGYTGTVTLSTNYVSPASGTSAISPAEISTFTNGVGTLTNVTYADAGTITITATDADGNTGTSTNILFLPDNFLVESTGGLNQVLNKPFNLRVTARNSSNSTCPNYKRNVNLTVSNVTPSGTSPTISPTTITGSSFSSGVKTVSMTYDKWGTGKITVTDSGYSTVTGKTSAAINFYPNSFSITVADPPASRTEFYLEELFDVTVTALDYNDDTIANYGGTITFIDEDDIDLPDDYQFASSTDNGAKAFTISGTEEKTFKLSVKDTSYTDATGESDDISLMYGKIKVNDVSGPIGTLSTTVEIVDKNGNVITNDNSTTFVVTYIESKANNTAVATVLDSTVSDGTATLSVTDTELETVTVTPDSDPYLEPESGTVIFSETAVGGGGAKRIGTDTRILYWRELREDER